MNLYGIRIWENKFLFAWVQKFVACYLWVQGGYDKLIYSDVMLTLLLVG